MRKFILILFLIGGTGYGSYYVYNMLNVETVGISGKIMVSQTSNYEITSPVTDSQSYDAVVRGVAKNNTKKSLKNVFIKYNIGGEETSATIFDIAPGQMVEFTTRSVKTRGSNPNYFLDDIIYEESSM